MMQVSFHLFRDGLFTLIRMIGMGVSESMSDQTFTAFCCPANGLFRDSNRIIRINPKKGGLNIGESKGPTHPIQSPWTDLAQCKIKFNRIYSFT